MQYYTVLQLQNQFGGDPTATIPSPAPGQFPGFTVTVTQAYREPCPSSPGPTPST